mmetsp:Transcript_2875/g.4134  ORF Transcript_2875/g.4134 Transcript_2875/m.4134 type:complete len:116 (-) Transcript_2875:916-1263(-)
MGVNQGSVLLFALGGLAFYHLCSVCRERSKDSDRPGAPAVVGDVSWLSHLFIKKKSVEDTVAIIISIIEIFVKEEVSFYAAFDPDDAPHAMTHQRTIPIAMLAACSFVCLHFENG